MQTDCLPRMWRVFVVAIFQKYNNQLMANDHPRRLLYVRYAALNA